MRSMRKEKIISFFLAMLMLFTALPISGISANAVTTSYVSVLYNGVEVNEVTVPENEKITLSSRLNGISADEYNWQIKIDAESDIWVDIDGYNEDTCIVDYALVGSVLDETDTAYIRLSASNSKNTYFSDAVAVTVSYVVITSYEAKLDTAVPVLEDASAENTKSKSRVASGKSRSADDGIAAVAEDGDELVTYDVTVNYLYQGGAEVTQANKANIKAGEDHKATIEVPTAAGYAPYYDKNKNNKFEADEKLTQTDTYGKIIFEIDEENIQKDIVFTIWYLPDYVSYTVNHYFQNANDDKYTLTKSNTRKGLTGSEVPADLYLTGDDVIGYSPYAYEQPTIAADNTTTVNIYYHINFYYVTYDLVNADAFGVEPVYVRYGTVVNVNEPTCPGYHFEGWELVGIGETGDNMPAPTDEEKTLYDLNDGSVKVPAANLKYRAKWTKGDSSYTVVYWREAESVAGSEEPIKYEYWGSEVYGGHYTEGGHWESDSNVKVGDTVNVSNYSSVPSSISTKTITVSNASGGTTKTTLDESVYFTYNKDKSESTPTYTVAGDGTTVVNVYFDRKEYTLKFYYAASSGSGNNTTYKVIGGSTYYFGANAASNRTDDVALFSQYLTARSTTEMGKQVGTVNKLPTLKEGVREARGYSEGTETSNNYTLYYISFTARYNADISDMWPTDVFNSVGTDGNSAASGWSGTEAFVSAWNGEYNVKYTQLNKNGNQTIKGKYNKLGYQILWDTSITGGKTADEDGTVAYLCFWENGADIKWSVPELYRYNIYLECLNQTNPTEKDAVQKTFNGSTKWYYLADSYDTVDDSDVNNQTTPPIHGFTPVGKDSVTLTDYDRSLYAEGYDVNFYYDRTRYKLEFVNQGKSLELEGTSGLTTVRYGVSLNYAGGYDLDGFKNEDGSLKYYPDTLDPGGYEFEGWYTSSTFASSTKFEFAADSTMPASDLILYAHWVPVTHGVTLYLDKTEAVKTDGTGIRLYSRTVQVEHGSLAPQPTQDYKNGDLTFVGWFYLDSNDLDENGEPKEKAFSFDVMPITQDMNIYAKWTSDIPREYTVYYRYYSDENNYVDMAPSTTGTALQGTTVTVNAKVGNQLDSAYRVGYFPKETSSHNFIISETNNIYVFEYELVKAVPYTVRYVDEQGNQLHEPKVVEDNRYTVVTEKFVQIEDYLPNHYSQELTVTSNGEGNVITFVYTRNETDAYYKIVHKIQNLTGDGYTEYKSIENAGKIGSEVSDSILSIVGFKFKNATKTVGTTTTGLAAQNGVVSGNIDESGLLIEIYYNREEYSYTVEYREYDATAEDNNGTELADKKTETVLYGTVVTENAKTIAGYDLVSQTPQSRVIGAKDEVIVFHYSEKSIGINYVEMAVGTDGKLQESKTGGEVGRSQESVAAVTGHPLGSIVTAKEGYRFVGWYRNKECTLAVNSAWVNEDNTLVPQTVNGLYQATTYYALFEKTTADLYIFTDFPANNNYKELDAGQSYIFTIEGVAGTATEDISLTISLHERDGVTVVDLPVGTYRVTQNTDWSWRYDPRQADYREITIKANGSINPNVSGGNWVRFTNTRTDSEWLDGNSYNENIFDGNAN